MHAIAWHIQACPSLELKIRPRFCPVSLSLSMYRAKFGQFQRYIYMSNFAVKFCFAFHKVIENASVCKNRD